MWNTSGYFKTSREPVFCPLTEIGRGDVQSILAPVGELLEMHLRVICKGNVGFAVFIQGTDFTAFDVINRADEAHYCAAQP